MFLATEILYDPFQLGRKVSLATVKLEFFYFGGELLQLNLGYVLVLDGRVSPALGCEGGFFLLLLLHADQFHLVGSELVLQDFVDDLLLGHSVQVVTL